MYEKFKSFIADDAIFFTIIILLVAVVSFSLGKQSSKSSTANLKFTQPAGVIFQKSTENPTVSVSNDEKVVNSSPTRVVVSKSGTKYHLLNCPGATQIKPENKVFFDSSALARAAGYTPAANCKGLE